MFITYCFYSIFLKNTSRGYIYIFERRREGGGGEGERERQTVMWERNINSLPPIGTPTKDQTHNLGMCPDQDWARNLLVYGMMLQPIEQPAKADSIQSCIGNPNQLEKY